MVEKLKGSKVKGSARIVLLTFLTFLTFQPLIGLAAGEPRVMAIVAGSDFPKDKLTLDEVKAIYLGEVQIFNYIRIYPIDQHYNQPIRTRFLTEILHMNRDAYIDYWNKRLYQKGGITPLLKKDSREVLETVQEHEGAVGYVWLDEADQEGIKILLKIDLR